MAETKDKLLEQSQETVDEDQCPGTWSGCPGGSPEDIEDLRWIKLDGSRLPRPAYVPYLCPMRVQLEVGKTYRYCACGRSRTQPFCDDACAAFPKDQPQPVEFSVERKQRQYLMCGCKFSRHPVMCDGSHIHVHEGFEEILERRRKEQRQKEQQESENKKENENEADHDASPKQENRPEQQQKQASDKIELAIEKPPEA